MSTPGPKPSFLMLEESFAAADDRFLDEWVKFNSPDVLRSFTQRWLADDRPWAKQQIVRYLQRDLNFAGHEVVVKRLFRYFEGARDHAMMARFMLAFDQIVRRKRVTRSWWDRETREAVREDHLFARPNKTVADQIGRTMEYGIGKWKKTLPLPDIRNKTSNRLFRHRTRNYLRRRVWRYFRWLSYSDPQAYLTSITGAIISYCDSDFAAGENIIDNWSLMHACYFHSDAVRFTAAHANLARGQSLGSLSAAPYHPELWTSPEAANCLLQIIGQAQSVLARVWAMELLKRDHVEAIQQIEIRLLMQLLSNSDPRVQGFASELFRQHKGLGTLTVSTWLELMQQCDQSLLPVICAAMTAHVSAARLDNSQLLELTKARAVPVAELGFQMLKDRHSERRLTTSELASLSLAKCESVAGSLTEWALQQLGSDENYSADAVVEFFDALTESIRSASMDWLEDANSRGHNDPVLWSKLIETPFDDVRLRVVESLQRRTRLPGAETDAMAPVWCSVILGVHRGGRTKLKAITQIQSAILSAPVRASTLLPVLAVAVRSLRAPERRSALAAVATMVRENSDLRNDIQRFIPELEWPI